MQISIHKLRLLYENISKKNNVNFSYYSGIFNYLNLSVHFSRDERDFDIANYKLFKNLKSSNKSGFRNLRKNGKYYYFNYFENFKEYHYLISNKVYLVILQDVFKFIKQIVDTLGIFFIILAKSFFNTINSNINNEKILVKKKIYSTYYWKIKKENSSSYYYPDIKKDKNSISYIISFADYNHFLSIQLFNIFKNIEYLSPINTIGIRSFLCSFFQFIHLYLNDLYLGLFIRDFNFIRFWYGWKKCSEIFYSILIYNSLIKLAKNSKECEFISWYENQVTNRAFSLGVSYARSKFKTSSTLSTYNGSPFTVNNKVQYLPTVNEYINGFWGDRYYVQDQDSMNEMKKYLNKINLNLELEIIPNSMVRSTNKSKEKFEDKLLKNQITIFTHDSYWDMIACLLSIFNTKNKNIVGPRKLIKEKNIINIRLHPTLNKKIALKEINLFSEIPKNINFKFIDNNLEPITNSINRSSYCFFGFSSYINLALSLNANVFAVNTNHIDKIPINTKVKFISKYQTLNPW